MVEIWCTLYDYCLSHISWTLKQYSTHIMFAALSFCMIILVSSLMHIYTSHECMYQIWSMYMKKFRSECVYGKEAHFCQNLMHILDTYSHGPYLVLPQQLWHQTTSSGYFAFMAGSWPANDMVLKLAMLNNWDSQSPALSRLSAPMHLGHGHGHDLDWICWGGDDNGLWGWDGELSLVLWWMT